MWEAIQANKKRSIFLFLAMGVCLLILGYAAGAALSPPDGGITGIVIASVIWILMAAISYSSGDSILLSLSHAKEVTHDVHPQLFNIVEEMKIAANLPAMPRIYIIPEPAPNAFATGIRPEKCAIAVTAGLLSRLNRSELQGVIAHETSHILNRDVLFMTFAGVMMGSIVLISEVFLRSLWFSSGRSRRYRSGSSSGGQAQLIIIVVSIVFAILAPIMARLLYLAISRKREYLADASAVRLTRYPEGLASALENISGVHIDLESANKVTAPMYIVNPLKAKGINASALSGTHPPVEERIKILRNMQHGVNFSEYQTSFMSVNKNVTGGVMPASAMEDKNNISIQIPPDKESRKKNIRESTRDVGDLMRAVNKYFFINCVCGMKIKVPPDFKDNKISCPRCGHVHDVPVDDMRTAGAIAGAAAALEKTEGSVTVNSPQENSEQTYKRKGTGWETLSCRCGRRGQLSPSFSASHLVCTNCGQSIRII